jgi:acetyltransferase-like isoleucine patch superfamily enzyme
MQIGAHSMIGTGTRLYDSDQHAIDVDTPEVQSDIRIGSHCWVASDACILRGVEIGDHSVVGARAVVLEDVPAHHVVVGAPARVIRRIGSRDGVSFPEG